MEHKKIDSFSQELLNIFPLIMRGVFRKYPDELGKGKLTLPQFFSLDLIDRHTQMKMKDIAKSLNVSLPAATGMIDRLYQLGLVRRKSDTKDRRVVVIELTHKGKKVLENTRLSRKRAVEDIFSKFSERERNAYIKILRKIKQILYPEER